LGSYGVPVDARLKGWSEYVGVDIRPDPEHVHVVGDIHRLSSLVEGRFDAIYSFSVFEHLAMPWTAVLEINRVANVGALVCITTHPAWPPHEEPWDFWRFSPHAFDVLFNRLTGFEIIESTAGLYGVILPLDSEWATRRMQHSPTPLGVSVLARKVSDIEPDFNWSGLSASDLLTTRYMEPSIR
jgi:hypothetical protein